MGDYFSYTMARASHIRWDDDAVHFVLDQRAYLDLYSASSLKQQSINLIPSQPIFVLMGEAANTNFIVFGLNSPRLPHSRQAL
jgi:hypothetical protein